jgi:putative flippase GtrA
MALDKNDKFTHSLITIKKSNFVYQIYYWLISFPLMYRMKRFLKYAVLGLAGTFIDILMIFGLHNILAYNYLWVTFISDFTKTFINFNLHKRFVFKNEVKAFSKKNLFAFGRYYVINFSAVIVIFIMVIGFVEFLNFPPIYAKLLADLIMNLTRFSAHKSIVFERPGKLGK